MSSQPSGSRTRLEDTLKSPSPKPGHHLYLSKPLPGSTTANNSSISLSLNDAALSPAAPHTPSGGGLRAHLGHLLPRHTYFRARVTIHQISSVPFVGGEFGVRWKFKNVQIPAPGKGGKGEGKGQGQGEGRGGKGGRPGLFDRVKSKSRAGEKRAPVDKGKGREDALMSPGVLSPGAEEAHNVVDALGLTSPGVEEEFGHAPQKIAFTRSASGPAAVSTTISATTSTGTDPSVVGMSRTQTTSSQTPSVSSHSSQTTHSSQHLSIDWGTTTTSTASAGTSTTNSSTTTVGLGLPPPSPSTTTTTTPSLSDPSSLSLPTPTPNNNNTTTTAYSPARGMTPFLPLKDHSVTWSYPLTTVLRIDVDRENAQLAPSPLKLVVMQRVVPDDPHGSPQNPRLGAVYLNLSEYVGQGAVERRYLLRESKTNATLKLTIELDYLSGERTYIPPPLAKGEILTGIAGFLDKNKDIVKRRPRALDIYGPYRDQEELEVDLLGLGSGTGMGLFSATTAGGLTARVGGLRTARSERGFALGDEHSQNREDDAHEASDTENDAQSHSHSHSHNYDSEVPSADEQESEAHEPTLTHRAPFDVQKLPFAYGTKTTEALIDALFNPVVIHEKREESPFTIYRPASGSPGMGAKGGVGRSKSTRSTVSSATDSTGNHSTGAGMGLGTGLGLSGVPPLMDRNGTIIAKPTNPNSNSGSKSKSRTRTSSRQGSLASSLNHDLLGNGNDSSAVSTYSSNASIRTTTSTSESSSTNNNNINLNDSPNSRSRSGDASVPRSTPEGRIVVDPTGVGTEEMQMQVGGLRGWWRRHTGVQRA